MLAVEAAQAKILDQIVEALPSETVAFGDAHGRVLAAEVIAPGDEPRVAMAAMDGYAVRAADVGDASVSLVVAFEVAAGRAADRPLPDGAVARIFTGAPVPPGADSVIMQEEATRDGDLVRFSLAPRPGQHVRQIGEELRAGEVIVAANTTLAAGAVGAIASLGATTLAVRRQPRVAIFSTGEELRGPGEPRASHELYDSNRPTLAALCREHGAAATALPPVGDDLAATVARLHALVDHDCIVSTGGVSVGDHDHVRAALDAAGFATLFWKVDMKPGKPLVVATRGAQLYFGLPGNPVSAQVSYHLFVRPALRKLLGLPPFGDVPRIVARLTAPAVAKQDPRRHHVRAHATVTPEGEVVLTPLAAQGSAALVTMATCNALVIVAGGTRYEAGDRAPALLIGALATTAPA